MGARAAAVSWTNTDLEAVPRCPVCADSRRRLLHADLTDPLLPDAPERWFLQHCLGCRSAYLDPRPSVASIHRAYLEYHTHTPCEARAPAESLSLVRRFRRRLANAYTNSRYGTHYQPQLANGELLARVGRWAREPLDVQFRWLPKPREGQRLLDVGCGSGDFLARAGDAGWETYGVDIDAQAVALSLTRCRNVRIGTIKTFDEKPGFFDAITLSHVIEHVHRPIELLRTAHRLLRPGGTLYIDTPNIDSRGAREFGRHWRGLEPPRHLVLFTPESLTSLLRKTGFGCPVMRQRRAVASGMFEASRRIAESTSAPRSDEPQSRLPRLFTGVPDLEFITLTAQREGP